MLTDPQWLERTKAEKIHAVIQGIPRRFSREIPVPPLVQEWVHGDSDKDGLYITGPVGTGKTHAMWCAITLQLVQHIKAAETGDEILRIRGPVVTRATRMMDGLRPGDDPKVVRNNLDALKNADLLAIDDLGAERPSDWTQERLYELIDERYAERLPTLVTTNVPLSRIGEFVGERVASRLAEMCTVVPLTGEDRRRPRPAA